MGKRWRVSREQACLRTEPSSKEGPQTSGHSAPGAPVPGGSPSPPSQLRAAQDGGTEQRLTCGGPSPALARGGDPLRTHREV